MAGVVYAIMELVASNSLAIVPGTWLNVEEDVCMPLAAKRLKGMCKHFLICSKV